MGKGGTCRLQRAGTLFSGRLSSTSGPLAQPGRALASHARGHWFKSSTVHKLRAGVSSFFRIMRRDDRFRAQVGLTQKEQIKEGMLA